jgi:hypothetical protein
MMLNLLFDPRREHLPSRPREFAAARAQGLSRLAAVYAATRQGLALIGPRARRQDCSVGKKARRMSNFKPAVLVHFHAAANSNPADRSRTRRITTLSKPK